MVKVGILLYEILLGVVFHISMHFNFGIGFSAAV